jgi:hypothetical protein
MRNIFWAFCWLVWGMNGVLAQEVRATFLTDSMQIGEPIAYTISFSHPEEWEVLFPDSSYQFKPFEWVRHEYFPTQTRDGLAHDSAVYYLRSFSMDSVQELRMPVWVVRAKADTSFFYPQEVSSVVLRFQLTPEVLQDSTMRKLQTDTNLSPIDAPFNYPLVGLIAVLVLLLVVIFVLLFGGRIRKAYRLRRMQILHERFVQSYKDSFATALNSSSIEHALFIWKDYLEKIEQIPYTTYTSSEIANATQNEMLKQHLKTLDRAIYGAEISQALEDSLSELLNFALISYENKVKEVRNV